jgi:hypothetical protein
MSQDEKPDVTSSSPRNRATPRRAAAAAKSNGVAAATSSAAKKREGSGSPRKTIKKEEADSDGYVSPDPAEGEGDDGDFKPKAEENDAAVKTPARRSRRTPGGTASSKKKMKLDSDADDQQPDYSTSKKDAKATPSSVTATPSKATLAKKLKQLEAYLQTPFPDHVAPTPEQCREVQEALAGVHGLPSRPDKLVDKEGAPAGCGAVPDVLDALVRTILSQNTTSASMSCT